MIAVLVVLALAAAGLAVALQRTRARLRWQTREHAVTRAACRAHHRAMERCVCGVAMAHAVGLPTPDEARGEVFATLVTDPRAPWMVVLNEPLRAPWKPLTRLTLGGPRCLPFATRWGDA